LIGVAGLSHDTVKLEINSLVERKLVEVKDGSLHITGAGIDYLRLTDEDLFLSKNVPRIIQTTPVKYAHSNPSQTGMGWRKVLNKEFIPYIIYPLLAALLAEVISKIWGLK